jgi:hypothetical protein
VQELAGKFIPAADEVNVILWQRDEPERLLFQKIGAQGHYGKPRQGIYASTPSGKLLGSTNERDAKVVAEMLRKSLAAWEAMDRKERLLASEPAKARKGPGALYPEDGLVLQVFTRDLPRPDGSEKKGYYVGAWNSDYAWFTREEASSMIPASHEPGAKQAVPGKLVRRIARCHLVDNVRGETQMFQDEHVKLAEMTLVVEKLEGELLRLNIEGAFRNEDKGKDAERGFEGKFLGRAAYDVSRNRFVSFDLVAAGTRWGPGSARGEDLAPAPMGAAFRIAATREGADRVPPAYLIAGLGPKYFQ